MTDSRSTVPVPGESRLPTLCCSFCSKDKDSIAKLVAGPGVYICDECVNLCNAILAAEMSGGPPSEGQPRGEQPAPGVVAWNERPDEELLASLVKIQAVMSQVDAAVHDHVDLLRSRGLSWTRIGQALGVSKQAAWERFSGED